MVFPVYRSANLFKEFSTILPFCAQNICFENSYLAIYVNVYRCLYSLRFYYVLFRICKSLFCTPSLILLNSYMKLQRIATYCVIIGRY